MQRLGGVYGLGRGGEGRYNCSCGQAATEPLWHWPCRQVCWEQHTLGAACNSSCHMLAWDLWWSLFRFHVT
jgi:hypothetical protein